jgi:hypothetical protein
MIKLLTHDNKALQKHAFGKGTTNDIITFINKVGVQKGPITLLKITYKICTKVLKYI